MTFDGRVLHEVRRPRSRSLLQWTAGIVLAVALATTLSAQERTNVAMSDKQRADRLLTVDCLLPGQVRQLGTRMTYLAPGRAIKTSAATARSAAASTSPTIGRTTRPPSRCGWPRPIPATRRRRPTSAKSTSAARPDYANAATWYRKAADQGYPRALINLGFLYEQGRGVPADPVAALKLYRQAAGLAGTVNLDARRPRRPCPRKS